MQIAIGTGLLRLEPFTAAWAGWWDVPGAAGLPIPGICHCLSLPGRCHGCRHGRDGAGTSPGFPGQGSTSPCGPHPHLLHRGRTKEFLNVQDKKPYGKKGKKMSWTVAELARTWLSFWKEGPGVFSWLCPGRFKGFCTIQLYPKVLLYFEKKAPLESWALPRRKTPSWLLSLDVVFSITHPAFPELLAWGFNHDESSQTFLGFEEKKRNINER